MGFGLLMGAIFPVYVSFFVEFKEGTFIWFVISCIVAGILMGFSNHYLLRLLLISKLKTISDVSKAISNHDLTQSYDLQSDDVIGEIVTTLNQMLTTLRDIVNELRTDSQLLNQGIEQICEDADTTSNAVQSQHQHIGEIQSIINQMTEDSENISTKATKAVTIADLAKAESDTAGTVVTQAISSINNLAGAVDNASLSINQLNEESMNIGGMLEVIQGISEQTNLLALNAAIEAARAGEQGRGFAVVADEVRILALRTKESTEEIQGIIETLQRVSKDAVEVMSEGKEQANESVSSASAAGQSLFQITDTIDDILQLSQKICDKTNSQLNVANQVNEGITNIGQIATESLDTAEGTNNSGQQLTKLSESLQGIVNQFKI